MVSATAMHSIALFSYAFADSDAMALSPGRASAADERFAPVLSGASIRKVQQRFGLHGLAIEDALCVPPPSA